MCAYRIWKGIFKSEIVNMVYGNIELELPHPPDFQGHHTFRAAIEYCGIYRYGARRILHLNTNGESGITQQRNTQSLNYKPPPFHRLTLSGALGSQSIQFECDSVTNNCITGNYSTQNPMDNGTFKVEITTDRIFNDSQQLETTECTLF